MFRQLFIRNGTANARQLLSSNTTALCHDQQSLINVLPSLQCIATPTRPVRGFGSSAASCYATVGRPPKASTSSTAKTRKTTSSRSTKTAKTTKAKSKAKPKKKILKPKKKATKAKKKVAKPKKRAVKKTLTELEAKRAKVIALRKVALLGRPKLLPSTAYMVFSVTQDFGGGTISEKAKLVSQAYKDLSASERENYEETAQRNRVENENTTKKWVEQHTPWEVKVANNARRHLNRIAKEPLPAGTKRALVAHGYILLKDTRSVKRADTPFVAYSRERWASGDFKGVSATDAMKELRSEFNSLSPQEAQKYHDIYKTGKLRYAEEYEQVYGRKPPQPRSKQ